MEDKVEVSIVIVCMNKLSNLDRCLPSIKRYTSVSYRIYVVAYLFSEENLHKLRNNYPEVKVIVSNEIRGFSENNNIALKDVCTPFTFVLNDDTEFTGPVLDQLLKSLKSTKDAAVMSPVLYRGDGTVQFCGRRKYTFGKFLLNQLGIRFDSKSKYESQHGTFKSYNISGAAFLIYTSVFKEMGFFDERYFFCPEDIALSTKLNKHGYYCYVDSTVPLIHYEGVSSKKTALFYATTSAAYLGDSYYFGTTMIRRAVILTLWSYKVLIFKIRKIIHATEHITDYLYIYQKVLNAYRDNITPKDLFVEEYKKVRA